MTEIDAITEEFEITSYQFDNFECPKCEKSWSWRNYDGLDYYEERKVECTCGAVLEVTAEVRMGFDFNVELTDES